MKFIQILKEITSKKPKKIEISYTDGNRFYSMRVDGKKIEYKEAKQLIDQLTGLQLPIRAVYVDDKVLEIIEALREQGIDAESYEFDVS